jgi:hypothetical protein
MEKNLPHIEFAVLLFTILFGIYLIGVKLGSSHEDNRSVLNRIEDAVHSITK